MSLTDQKIDTIIVLGTFLSRQHEKSMLLEEYMKNGAKLIYLFSMEDPVFSPKSHFFSRYEVGSEEGVLALLAKALLDQKTLPHTLQSYFDDLDEGYLSAESNIGEEEIEEIQNLCGHSKAILLWLGEDILKHPCANNCLQIAHLMAIYGNIMLQGMTKPNHNPVMEIDDIAPLKSYDGTIVYQCLLKEQSEVDTLIGSAQFALAAKIHDHEKVTIVTKEGTYTRMFLRDEHLKGTIALMPSQKLGQEYPYSVAKITKAEV